MEKLIEKIAEAEKMADNKISMAQKESKEILESAQKKAEDYRITSLQTFKENKKHAIESANSSADDLYGRMMIKIDKDVEIARYQVQDEISKITTVVFEEVKKWQL